MSALSDDKLNLALRVFIGEEASVSSRRREVQAVVDLLNAEIAGRYQSGSASVDELLAAERGWPANPGRSKEVGAHSHHVDRPPNVAG